jgi:serine/threonine-protein kinase
MGRVYCAEQVALGRTVAVKVVHPHLAGDELASARFLNEARAASRLSHPNSVAIFDFGRTTEGHPYIVMEYLRGRDLGRVALSEGPLPLRRVVDILRQTLAALDEAHALEIIHRDLKPDNIVLEPLRSGLDFVKVVDFGLAKLLTARDLQRPARSTLTQPGLVCGTPEYMSPEQGRGDSLDARSDLYSVGVVLFELLAGSQPFVGETPTQTLLLHLTQPPPDPRDAAPDRAIPAVFAELTLRSLAKSREDRFQTARAFGEALEQALFEVEGRVSARFDAAPTTAIRCGQCGGLSPLGQRFCGHCGALIAPTPPATPKVISRTPVKPAAARFIAMANASLDREGGRAGVAPAPWLDPRPLLAREEAITWLDHRREDAAVIPAAAHLVGEAGMGRTRLIREMLGRWSARGDHTVLAGPDPTGAQIADAALRGVLVGLVGSPDEMSPFELGPEVSADVRRGLAVLFGTAPGEPLDANARRRALGETLRWALDRAASGLAPSARVVVAVDDLDFVDATSRGVFLDLLAAPPPLPVLFVVSDGDGEHPAGDPAAGEVWRLSPLPPEAFEGYLPARWAPRGVALSPLHFEQLLAWGRETSDPPPERLLDLIAGRIGRRSNEARHALQAVVSWGDNAGLGVLRHLLPPSIDVAAAVAELERTGHIAVGEGGIRIAHPLIGRVTFTTMPAGRKRELFERICEVRPDAPLEVRARQARHGGSPLEALALLDELGARRLAMGDPEGRVRALRQALDLARRALYHDELDDPLRAVLIFSRKLAEALAAMPTACSGRRWGALRRRASTAPTFWARWPKSPARGSTRARRAATLPKR